MASAPIPWTAPFNKQFRAVVAGSVVSAQFRLSPGAVGSLGPDGRGVCPHLVISPEVEPVGTGGANVIDEFGNIREAASDVPFANSIGVISGEEPFFWVDIGKPVYLPWNARVAVEGGLVTGAAQIALDVQSYNSTPCVISNTTPIWDIPTDWMEMALKKNYIPTRTMFRAYGPSNLAPLGPPTITFQNVPAGGTPIQLPRGAHSVQVPQATDVVFTTFGTSVTVRVTPGTPMPIGFNSQGAFSATPGAAIPLISFIVAIG